MVSNLRIFFVPVLVGVAIAGAFFSGKYVGAHDHATVVAVAAEINRADESALRLVIAHAAATSIREGKAGDALRVLDQFAQLQVENVAGCLNREACASWLGSPQRQAELRALVEARSKSKVAQ